MQSTSLSFSSVARSRSASTSFTALALNNRSSALLHA
jgi:hypothetical protein